jgi:hypothetical protein
MCFSPGRYHYHLNDSFISTYVIVAQNKYDLRRLKIQIKELVFNLQLKSKGQQCGSFFLNSQYDRYN